MKLSTTGAVKEIFVEATRQSLARNLQTPGDWDSYKAILQQTDARLQAERAAYARDYTARIAEAKEIILREEHGVRLDHPLPPGAMKQSNADALQFKADARVRQDHERRVATIRSDELEQYRSLTADIRARNEPKLSQTRAQDPATPNPVPTRTGPTQQR